MENPFPERITIKVSGLEVTNQRWKDWEDGNNAGYNVGWAEAYPEARDMGYKAGYNCGWKEGYEEGNDDGFTDGGQYIKTLVQELLDQY